MAGVKEHGQPGLGEDFVQRVGDAIVWSEKAQALGEALTRELPPILADLQAKFSVTEPVTIEDVPDNLREEWIAKDGRVRMRVLFWLSLFGAALAAPAHAPAQDRCEPASSGASVTGTAAATAPAVEMATGRGSAAAITASTIRARGRSAGSRAAQPNSARAGSTMRPIGTSTWRSLPKPSQSTVVV